VAFHKNLILLCISHLFTLGFTHNLRIKYSAEKCVVTFRKHKNGIRAEVCVKDVRKSKVLGTQTDSKEWAALMEAKLTKTPEQER